jgi:hypothetical protein
MHLWNNFSIIPGAGTAAVNNHRSNNAYLVGSFFYDSHISIGEYRRIQSDSRSYKWE